MRNTVVEFCIKDDELNDPPISEDAIVGLNITDIITLSKIRETSNKLILYLQTLLKNVDYNL